MICHFLEQPTYDNLQRSVQTIDSEVKLCKDLDTSQVECIQYLIRDWGFQHIQEQMTLSRKKNYSTINGKKQASGHFIKAVDYAKESQRQFDHYEIWSYTPDSLCIRFFSHKT